MRALILLVGSEVPGTAGLGEKLKDSGFDVRDCATGQEAVRSLIEGRPSVVISDHHLPDMSGLDVLRRVRRGREHRDVPFLLLSESADEIDRVIAFELGADDYVVKPVSVRELVLRVHAVLRRFRTSPSQQSNFLTVGPLEIDVPRHAVAVQGRHIELTTNEFKLLLDLASHRGRVQRRDELLERVWRMPGEQETRTVDTHVKRLRQKLGDAGSYIETVRGVGYRMRDAS